MNTDIPFLDELRRELLDAGTRPAVHRRPVRYRPTGPLVALAAFVLVLAVAGALLFASERIRPDRTPEGPNPEVSTVDASVAGYLTQIADRSVVLRRDPFVVQAPSAEEPRFLPGALGDEVVLWPLAPGDERIETVVEWLNRRTTATADADGASMSPDPALPVVSLGFVAEDQSHIVLYGARDGALCIARIAPVGSGVGCGIDVTPRYHLDYGPVLVSASPSIGSVQIRVPEATSVVAIVTSDGDRRWQRAVSGYASFPVWLTEGSTIDVEAYGADGDLLGHWATELSP